MALTVETSSMIETRAGQVRVATAGRGDRTLLAITAIGEPWMTAAMPADLGDLFTIHLMELPGTGRSSLRAEAASVESMVAAIVDVAATLAESPTLFGHSMNGTLTLAAANPSACAGVIAVTPPPSLPPDPAQSTAYWDARAGDDRRRRGRELVTAYEATTDATERRALQEKFDRLRRWYDLDADHNDLDRLADMKIDWVGSVFESGRTVDWPKTMKEVDCAVLLALGEYDFVAPPTAWTDDITPPRSTVHLFTRSGHTPYLEESDEFVRITEMWLAGLER